MSYFNFAITVVGYLLAVAGVGMRWGAGWACLVGGVVLFVAGGLGSAREGR